MTFAAYIAWATAVFSPTRCGLRGRGQDDNDTYLFFPDFFEKLPMKRIARIVPITGALADDKVSVTLADGYAFAGACLLMFRLHQPPGR